MKTVFSNHMVAHVWAQQTQSEGKSSNGNFSFRDDTLYSYSTPIARFVFDNHGNRQTLITSNSYSVTTNGKHKNAAGRAVHYEYFSVPTIRRGGRGQELDHAANLAHLLTEYADAKARAMRQRDPPQGYTFEHLGKLHAAAWDYAGAFGLDGPEDTLAADRKIIEDHHIARNIRNNSPEAKAKRERAAARKEELELSRIERAIAAWRKTGQFKPALTYQEQRRAPVMMRQNGEELVTSLGARFPVEHGKLAFAFILRQRMKAEAWERNGHSIHLGHFVIDRIEADGTVKAGCHTVAWEEVERMARTLGLLPPEPQQITA